jgi:hypothetical protein
MRVKTDAKSVDYLLDSQISRWRVVLPERRFKTNEGGGT